MNDKTYRAFLDLLMCCDPYPVQGKVGQHGHGLLLDYADEEAESRDYDEWIAAYHEFKPN